MSDYYCELCSGKIPAVGFICRERAGRDIPVCADHMKEAFDPVGDAEKRGYLRELAEAEEIAEAARQFMAAAVDDRVKNRWKFLDERQARCGDIDGTWDGFELWEARNMLNLQFAKLAERRRAAE